MWLPRESHIPWQQCRDASQEVLKQLWKLNIKKPEVPHTTISFPQRIECKDRCDPDSLGKVPDSLQCLTKIREGLHHYHKLLTRFSNSGLTAELQDALNSLLQLLLTEDGGSQKETNSPAILDNVQEWEKTPLQNFTLWRLQSFAVVVARVLSHCASLSEASMI
uniref:Interleukin-23 subunit alpha n=1 Tax=Pogona vitticeps TaxID=103695 RepID=A0ABM5FNK1_9SAUR